VAKGTRSFSWTFVRSVPSLPPLPVLFGTFEDSLSTKLALVVASNNGNTQLKVFDNFFANRTLIGSTTVSGIFNPTSANHFASHLDLAGTYTDPDGNTGVAIVFGNGDGTFNPDPLFIRDPPGYASQSIFVADFNGDNKLDIVSGSSTKPNELEVLLNSSNPKTPAVSVTSSLNPSTYGETVTFTATVKPRPLNWPTESVTFYSGPNRLGPAVKLENGTASVSTTKLEPGTHTITAEYSGDCCDYLPASASISQVVNK